MGVITSIFKGNDKLPSNVFVDFENASPPEGNEEAVALNAEVMAVMEKGAALLEQAKNYEDCQGMFREAMMNSSDTSKLKAAFMAVLPKVKLIKDFVEFSKELEGCAPRLVHLLVNVEDLGSQQALVKRLADMVNFCLEFDQAKMMTPGMQNDFANYRRSMSAFRTSVKLEVGESETNQIAMFMGPATPMMNGLADTVGGLFKQNREVLKLFASLANICCSLVLGEKISSPEAILFVLRAMTGAIVLYDRVDPSGVFKRSSGVDVKKCVQALVSKKPETLPLLNAVRFSTATYKSHDTPRKLHDFIEQACA